MADITTVKAYLELCKPRVVLMMLLTMWAGMYLAALQPIPLALWVHATLGVALLCGAGATTNHIVDRKFDALMARTKRRPLPTQKLSLQEASLFAVAQGITGFLVLYYYVNPLTSILTLCATFGYACIYSLYLKHTTSQNIVIGGLAGAMPPLLGWTAVSGTLDPKGWLLVLIIFTWTPAHFWALCLHRYHDYKETGIPMLPITHGITFTKWHIVFYSLLTAACSLLPYVIGMSGLFYLVAVIILNAGLLRYALKLQFSVQDEQQLQPAGGNTPPIALKTFHYSLIYLTGLFTAILLDHYLITN
jgi:protoheme IX farnesyltransferase